ncbi:MAG: TonB-dependent receptor [Gammaproteobacteria bacterium]|jgi:vitamin B12 transporter|nr:TonB-dependent receptor [Gammaproteobacteria bacterium]
MRLFRFVAATALLLFVAPHVHASDISPSDTIIVTATRTEIPLEQATVPVRVITRDDIELSLATDLAELLRFEAGIDIGRNGGPGQATSFFMRGTESNHTLVLIDGVRMNPGTIGGAAIQHISPEVIERVEIVKGARSALFGTDAIGGVINIITRRADETHIEGGAGAGSFDSRSAFLSGGVRNEENQFGITLDWQDTEGYPPRVESDVDRGYDNLSLNIHAARDIGSGEISLRHWRAEGTVEYLDFFLTPVDQDFRNAVTAFQFDKQLSERGTNKLIVSHMMDRIEQNQSDDFVESDRLSLDWQHTLAFSEHTVTAGLFAMKENAKTLSFGSGFDEDTDVRALFLQDQWISDRHRAFVAARLTDHDSFGNQTTYNVEYGYELTPSWTVRAGLGRAFRAPDATDRYGFGGNPDLEPEIANEYQLGLRYAPGSRHSVDIEFYANDIEDLIEFDFATFTLVNIDTAEIRGTQLGYEYLGDTFSLRADLVRQKAENTSNDTRLLRRAEESITLSYTQDVGQHRLGLSVLASGDREDFGGVTLPGYVVASLTGQIRLSKTLQLNARVENLFDADYQTAANFRMQGRSAFVELKYRRP